LVVGAVEGLASASFLPAKSGDFVLFCRVSELGDFLLAMSIPVYQGGVKMLTVV
jgi:hypothetical protein